MQIFNWIKKKKMPVLQLNEEGFYLSEEEKNKLKKLDIEKILPLRTNERINIFSELIGKEKADWVNDRFERDLVLKNQKAGMLNWVNNKTDIKENFRKEINKRINSLDRALSPEEEEVFLGKLVELALGIGVTEEEKETIFKLSQKVEEARVKMENGGDAEEYGEALNTYNKYVDALKES